jgi:hypothetical protein
MISSVARRSRSSGLTMHPKRPSAIIDCRGPIRNPIRAPARRPCLTSTGYCMQKLRCIGFAVPTVHRGPRREFFIKPPDLFSQIFPRSTSLEISVSAVASVTGFIRLMGKPCRGNVSFGVGFDSVSVLAIH